MNIIGLIILNVILGVGGQALAKIGVTRIGQFSDMPLLLFFYKTATSPYIIFGFLTYVISALIWFMVLSKTQLSIAYPALSLGYILIVFVGYFFLNEPLNLSKIAGVLLICSGVYLIFHYN